MVGSAQKFGNWHQRVKEGNGNQHTKQTRMCVWYGEKGKGEQVRQERRITGNNAGKQAVRVCGMVVAVGRQRTVIKSTAGKRTGRHQ